MNKSLVILLIRHPHGLGQGHVSTPELGTGISPSKNSRCTNGKGVGPHVGVGQCGYIYSYGMNEADACLQAP